MSVRELCSRAELVLNYQAANHVFVGQFAGEFGKFMINHSLLDSWGEGSPTTEFTALGRDDRFKRYIPRLALAASRLQLFFLSEIMVAKFPSFRRSILRAEEHFDQ